MTNPQYTDDLREYFFSAAPEIVALDTIELRHPMIVDGGDPVAVRFVNDPADLTATLEDDAPMNAGASVTFNKGRFEFLVPESASPGLPSCDIGVLNVGGDLQAKLELAVSYPAPVEVSYRQFLSDDLTAPAYVLHGLTLRKVRAGVLRVTGTAGFEDFLNRPSPRDIYTVKRFPTLGR